MLLQWVVGDSLGSTKDGYGSLHLGELARENGHFCMCCCSSSSKVLIHSVAILIDFGVGDRCAGLNSKRISFQMATWPSRGIR